MTDFRTRHFLQELENKDPLIFRAIAEDRLSQQTSIELIASENTFSLACMQALGALIANKAVEGFPGHRYHAGSEIADVIEQAVIDRAKALFDCRYVNAQPHSGTQANQAVYLALLKPGDRILSMDLNSGGHLSHGARASQTGRWFDMSHYTVDARTERLDYDEIEKMALERRPAMIIAGGSAYPRHIDFARMRQIADRIGAFFLVDMAHFGGLVAAGEHPSPIPFADVTTCTLCKTMRGGPGALILSNREDLAKKLQSAVFPGIQGGAQMQVIAAKAVTLLEAMQPEFKDYGRRVVENAKTLASALSKRGLRIVTGGTDTHLLLVDVSSWGLTGLRAQHVLEAANFNTNSNPVPFDSQRPSEWVGVRLGTSAGTTRGFGPDEFERIGGVISDLLEAARDNREQAVIAQAREWALKLCARFPLFDDISEGDARQTA